MIRYLIGFDGYLGVNWMILWVVIFVFLKYICMNFYVNLIWVCLRRIRIKRFFG